MTVRAASGATMFLSLCLAACGPRPELLRVSENCPAHEYVDEFARALAISADGQMLAAGAFGSPVPAWASAA